MVCTACHSQWDLRSSSSASGSRLRFTASGSVDTVEREVKPEGAKVFPLSVALQTTASGTPPNDGWVSDPTRSPTATGIAHGQW